MSVTKFPHRLYMIDLGNNQYEQPIYVFYKNWGPMVEFLKREHKIEFPDPKPARNSHRAFMWEDESSRLPGKKIYYVFFWRINKSTQSIRDVGHEMNHVARAIHRHVGIKENETTEESACYFQDTLVGMVYDGVKANKKKFGE